MSEDPEIYAFLLKHLQSVQDNDVDAYHATTSPELTLYEWWVTPHRIDGLPFHDFMLAENARRGTVFGTEGGVPASSGDASSGEASGGDASGAGASGESIPGKDSWDASQKRALTRFDLANLRIQRYGDAAIASYTLLTSTSTPQGVRVAAHNESRVMVKQAGQWQVVHVHKSPAWPAPHIQD